jgi:hypothetical protein
MLKHIGRIALAASGVLILVDCGSSTAPTPLTPAQLARHIDSLAVKAEYGSRYPMLSIAELGPALGVSPTSIVVTTGSGTHTWHGFMYRSVPPKGVSPTDSVYAIVAYSDNSLTNILYAQAAFQYNRQHTIVEMVVDTAYVAVSTATSTVTLTSTGGDCALVAGLTNYTASPQPGECVLASFTGGFSGTFSTTNTEFQTVSIGVQSFPGLSKQ